MIFKSGRHERYVGSCNHFGSGMSDIHRNSSMDLMIRGSPPDGGERGSTGSAANCGMGGGESAAERSIRWKVGGARGVGKQNSLVRGEKRSPVLGASRAKMWVWTRGSQLLTLRGRPR